MGPELLIAGMALSAGASVLQGIQGMNAANYQAEVAKNNQKIMEANAQRTLQDAQQVQQDQDLQSLALMGAQDAIMGASGVDFGSGSFLRARKGSKELARRDALNIRHAAEMEAYSQRVGAMSFGAQAQGYRMAAQNSLLGGVLGAGSSLVGGFSQYQQYKRFQQRGVG